MPRRRTFTSELYRAARLSATRKGHPHWQSVTEGEGQEHGARASAWACRGMAEVVAMNKLWSVQQVRSALC